MDESEFSIAAQDGQRIRGVYRESGQKVIGTFLHGLLSDCEGGKSMYLWEQAVQKNRSWVRFDMRAHGKSDGVFEEFQISRAIEDTERVLDRFPNHRKFLAGSSMGGWVAAQVALSRSDIDGLVLIAPAFDFIGSIFQSLATDEQEQWKREGRKSFESPYPDSDFTLSYDAVVDAAQYDSIFRATEFSCPIKILHGELDDVVPVEQSMKFAQHITSSVDVKVVPKGDHRLTDHVHLISAALDELWRES